MSRRVSPNSDTRVERPAGAADHHLGQGPSGDRFEDAGLEQRVDAGEAPRFGEATFLVDDLEPFAMLRGNAVHPFVSEHEQVGGGTFPRVGQLTDEVIPVLGETRSRVVDAEHPPAEPVTDDAQLGVVFRSCFEVGGDVLERGVRPRDEQRPRRSGGVEIQPQDRDPQSHGSAGLLSQGAWDPSEPDAEESAQRNQRVDNIAVVEMVAGDLGHQQRDAGGDDDPAEHRCRPRTGEAEADDTDDQADKENGEGSPREQRRGGQLCGE